MIDQIQAKATTYIYDTPLWKVRRLGDGWYQGETPLWTGVTERTRDFQEARRWIETQVERFLASLGYMRGVVSPAQRRSASAQ